MTASDAAPGGSDTSVAAYEELRRHVLAGSAFGTHLGLVLLLREGIASWMSRCSAYSAPVAPAADRDRCAAAPYVSDEIHADVVRVLASMALSGLDKERNP